MDNNNNENGNTFLAIRTEAHTKTELKELVTKWCDNPDVPALQKYIFIKELENAVKLAIEQLRGPAKVSYLEFTKGETNKTEYFGVTVSTQSTITKKTLEKQYLYSDTVDQLVKEAEDLEKQLKAKNDAIKAMKVMEINQGTAKEITTDSLLSDEVEEKELPVEDTFNLVITLKD